MNTNGIKNEEKIAFNLLFTTEDILRNVQEISDFLAVALLFSLPSLDSLC